MDNTITQDKLEKYFEKTNKALSEVKKNIVPEKEDDAREIIEMAENYLSDADHFYKENKWVDAFAAINYAHGWLDSGVRLGIFNVYDDTLFTVK